MLSCLWPSPPSLNCSRLTHSRVNIDRFWMGAAISVLLLLSRLISVRLVARLEPLDKELRRQEVLVAVAQEVLVAVAQEVLEKAVVQVVLVAVDQEVLAAVAREVLVAVAQEVLEKEVAREVPLVKAMVQQEVLLVVAQQEVRVERAVARKVPLVEAVVRAVLLVYAMAREVPQADVVAQEVPLAGAMAREAPLVDAVAREVPLQGLQLGDLEQLTPPRECLLIFHLQVHAVAADTRCRALQGHLDSLVRMVIRECREVLASLDKTHFRLPHCLIMSRVKNVNYPRERPVNPEGPELQDWQDKTDSPA
uniref:Secreted protein n=1 Tax=Globodera pallida TaxID=36090 RepID=A0A183BIS6_GLOPA